VPAVSPRPVAVIDPVAQFLFLCQDHRDFALWWQSVEQRILPFLTTVSLGVGHVSLTLVPSPTDYETRVVFLASRKSNASAASFFLASLFEARTPLHISFFIFFFCSSSRLLSNCRRLPSPALFYQLAANVVPRRHRTTIPSLAAVLFFSLSSPRPVPFSFLYTNTFFDVETSVNSDRAFDPDRRDLIFLARRQIAFFQKWCLSSPPPGPRSFFQCITPIFPR